MWQVLVSFARDLENMDGDSRCDGCAVAARKYLEDRFPDGYDPRACWFASVGRAELARRAGVDERTAQRAIAALVGAGLVSCEGSLVGRRGRVSCYALEPLGGDCEGVSIQERAPPAAAAPGMTDQKQTDG